MSDREARMLPSGKVTRSARKYIAEWRKLGRLVAEAHGPEWRCHAFDPGLSICNTETWRSISIEMPTARAIARLMEATNE